MSVTDRHQFAIFNCLQIGDFSNIHSCQLTTHEYKSMTLRVKKVLMETGIRNFWVKVFVVRLKSTGLRLTQTDILFTWPNLGVHTSDITAERVP